MQTKTLALFTALVIASGCGSTQKRLDTLEQQLRQVRAENGELKDQLASSQKDSADAPLPPSDAPAASPVSQDKGLLTGNQVMTLADSNPGIFQCFLDRDPGLGGGHWMAIVNEHLQAAELAINSQPVVVYEPIGTLWRKVKIFHEDGAMSDPMGRKYFSIIPVGKTCYAPMPGRYTGDHLATYTLSGKAWSKDVNSIGSINVYSGQHSGRMKTNRYFTKKLNPGRLTHVRLDRFDFN